MNTFMLEHALSWLLALPLLGSLLVWAFPKKPQKAIELFTLGIMLFTALLALGIWFGFQKMIGMQYQETWQWLPRYGIAYRLGIDALSLPLVVLVALLTPFAWGAVSGPLQQQPRAWASALLLLEGCMLGSLTAQDLLLFYIFWEGMLLPVYLLMVVFGRQAGVASEGRSSPCTLKQPALLFVLFTCFGSLLMLAAIASLGFWSKHTGDITFCWPELQQRLAVSAGGLPRDWLFLAFLLAFAIKIPLFPLHGWQVATYRQAPTALVGLLSGCMSKIGLYGLLRYGFGLLGEESFWALATLALLGSVGAIYAAWLALGQKDLRALLAYSSMSHLNWLVVGLASTTFLGLLGASCQMVAHGVVTVAMWSFVALLERRGVDEPLQQKGLLSQGSFGWIWLWLSFAAVGLPGLSGFVGEWLMLMGSFEALQYFSYFYYVIPALLLGLLLGATYALSTVQRMCFGVAEKPLSQKYFSNSERCLLYPLLIFTLVFGLAPQFFLEPLHKPYEDYSHQLQASWQKWLSKEDGAQAPHSQKGESL